ncbi:hypothetical protein RDI58_018264 [Solanum bulbocastanum]
MSFSGA